MKTTTKIDQNYSGNIEQDEDDCYYSISYYINDKKEYIPLTVNINWKEMEMIKIRRKIQKLLDRL